MRVPSAILGRYRSRISGPLLDRFDLIVRVGRVEATEYSGPGGETSASSPLVERARAAQAAARPDQPPSGVREQRRSNLQPCSWGMRSASVSSLPVAQTVSVG